MSKNKPTFEEAINQLEAIIEGIEVGDIGLEESLAEYEKGMKLIAQCRRILTTAQKRVAELTVDSEGQLKVEPQSEEPVT